MASAAAPRRATRIHTIWERIVLAGATAAITWTSAKYPSRSAQCRKRPELSGGQTGAEYGTKREQQATCSATGSAACLRLRRQAEQASLQNLPGQLLSHRHRRGPNGRRQALPVRRDRPNLEACLRQAGERSHGAWA